MSLQGRQLRALREMIPFVILATLAVICRFLSRRIKRATVGPDDYMIIVGLVFTWAAFADCVVRECTTSYLAKALFGFADLASIRTLSRGWKAYNISPQREFVWVVEGM